MRARTQEELASPERIARLAGNPSRMPKYFRELVRQQFAEENIQFLHDTAMGDQKFETPVVLPGGGKGVPPRVEVVEVEAPSAVRVKAAEAILGIAIPRQSGLVDGDDKGITGIMLLPPLDAAHGEGDDHGGKEIIEEEVSGIEDSRKEDRDEAPPPIERVVRPEIVKHILAARRARSGATNGDSPGGHA